MKNILLLLFIINAGFVNAQTTSIKNYKSLEFFYIDNGKINRNGIFDFAGLMDDLKTSIQNVGNKDNYKFVMFQPNNSDPKIQTNYKERESYINSIYELNEYEGPKFFYDDDAVLNWINKVPFLITEEANLYIYLQGDFVFKSITKANGEISLLLRYLPQQLYTLTNCPAKSFNVFIRIANSKSTGQSKAWFEDNVNRLINFYNEKDKSNYINFTVKVYDEAD